MADSDQSSYITRFDVETQTMQYFAGSDWYDVPSSSGGAAGTTAGDIQLTDGSGTFVVDENKFIYDTSSTTLYVNNLQITDDTANGEDFFTTLSGNNLIIGTHNTNGITLIDGDGDNIGIGTFTPDASAVVDVTSTGNNKGFLVPRMTTTQRDAIDTPAEGLVIYNLTTHTLNFWNGSAWTAV